MLSFPMTICKRQPSLSVAVLVPTSSDDCFSRPFACICQYWWYPNTTDLGVAELFKKCHYTAFTDGWDGAHFICCCAEVTTYHFIHPVDVERHQCSASAITAQFFVKCYSSCFSSFNPSYPSSDCTHIHTSFTIHSKQMFVNACWLVTFKVRGRGPITAHCFNCMSISVILESNVVLYLLSETASTNSK